jgi:hypothetical protein
MKLFSLYHDFYKFLEKITPYSEKWSVYFEDYYKIHQLFLENYFSHFPLIDPSNLKERVEAIRPSDYSQLRNLIGFCPPEGIIQEAYEKCSAVVPPKKEVEVYLFIGFFSADAFVMTIGERPVICFGLERFKDFRLLKILLAHEYAHFLLNLSQGLVPEEKKIKWLILSEGISTYFSSLIFPDRPLPDHFLFRRDRFNWCQAHDRYLREIFCSEKFSSQELMDYYFKGNPELGLPARVAKYLGFEAVKIYLGQNKDTALKSLLFDKELALSLEL